MLLLRKLCDVNTSDCVSPFRKKVSMTMWSKLIGNVFKGAINAISCAKQMAYTVSFHAVNGLLYIKVKMSPLLWVTSYNALADTCVYLSKFFMYYDKITAPGQSKLRTLLLCVYDSLDYPCALT